jgi:hypothetical protein
MTRRRLCDRQQSESGVARLPPVAHDAVEQLEAHNVGPGSPDPSGPAGKPVKWGRSSLTAVGGLLAHTADHGGLETVVSGVMGGVEETPGEQRELFARTSLQSRRTISGTAAGASDRRSMNSP